MKQTHSRLGFTLAELLIVVAIIAVLAGISIPIFTAQKKKAQIAVVRANARNARSAAYALFLTDGFYKSSDTYGYYVYTVKNGTAELVASYKSPGSDYPNLNNKFDNKYQNTSNGKESPDYNYPYIYVYIKSKSSTSEIQQNKADIQTCPYYDAKTQDIVFASGQEYGDDA